MPQFPTQGLLPLLDEEVKIPRSSDHTFLNKINTKFDKNPRFKGRIRKGAETREWEFGVVHYAGMVSYDVRGFSVRAPPRPSSALRCHCPLRPLPAPAAQEKNKDELMLNLRELMQSSTIPFLNMLFSEEGGGDAVHAAAAAVALPASPGTPLASPGAPHRPPLQSQGSTAQLTSGGAAAAPAGGSREASNKVSQGAQFRNQVRRDTAWP